MGSNATLLERRESLEEFGQVDVRVAAGRQGLLGHLLQPSVHVFLFAPGLHAICEGGEEDEATVRLVSEVRFSLSSGFLIVHERRPRAGRGDSLEM